jgi:hypothetical protein
MARFNINSSLSPKPKISRLLHLWLADKSSTWTWRRVELLTKERQLWTNGISFPCNTRRETEDRVTSHSGDETQAALQLAVKSMRCVLNKQLCVIGYLTRKISCVTLWRIFSGRPYAMRGGSSSHLSARQYHVSFWACSCNTAFFLVRVPPDVIYLQLSTPKAVAV